MTAPLLTVLNTLRATVDPADTRAVLAKAAVVDGVDPKALRVAWEDWKRLRASEVTVLYASDAMGAA